MRFARLRREVKASSMERERVALCSKAHGVMSFAFFGILKTNPKRSHVIYGIQKERRGVLETYTEFRLLILIDSSS